MITSDFTTTLLVAQTPEAAFHAINNPREWWSAEIEGSTNKLHDEFKYHFEDIHRCQLKVIELIPGEKVAWLVTGNYFKAGIFNDASHLTDHNASTKDQSEWTGTKISFEISEKGHQTQIRFTHLGLVPEYACFEACSSGWTHYIRESLLRLITTGKGEPNSTGNAKTKEEEQFQSAPDKA